MTDVSNRELFATFSRIGLLSFGGPAAQIALMHRMLVDEKQWLSEQSFLRALSLCMLLPGPEAMQLATYAGWRLRGTTGGLIAGLLFVLPGAGVIAVLALGYAAFGQVPLVQAAFAGIKAAVIVIVLQALLKVAQRALETRAAWWLAASAFAALFVFGVPFPLIILAAGLFGAMTVSETAVSARPISGPAPNILRTVILWGAIWAAPIAVLWMLDHSFLLQLGLFFSKLAVVTFGGAYAVLAYMTQSVVQDFGWITTAQMIDALGLAETTPGPLILVTQFVGMLAGYAQGGVGMALIAGLIALWVTFTPCFLWIFVAGPYLDIISMKPRFSGALRAITAAVVGVILNLAIWFALHVIFADVTHLAPLALPVPVLATLDVGAVVLGVLAAVLLLGWRIGMVPGLGLLAAAGLLMSLL